MPQKKTVQISGLKKKFMHRKFFTLQIRLLLMVRPLAAPSSTKGSQALELATRLLVVKVP